MRLYGLIGYPLTHSFSEKYFTEKFSREKISDASYRLFPLPDIAALPELIRSQPDLRGLNVTIPWKEKVISFLDHVDETAASVGAVNCIRIERGEKTELTGFNTDAYGFRQSLKPFLASHHERALILGTGGASKAVAHVLRGIGVDCIFVSRKPEANSTETILSYEALNPHVMNACKLIVNCSPVGTFPDVHAAPAIPYEFLSNTHFLYDLVYNPAETEFLRRGKEKGALTLNGYDMLQLQAEKAWEFFN